MRLFKSNKSKDSIDRSTGSRSSSPTPPEAAYPQSQTLQQQYPPQHPQPYGGVNPVHTDRFRQQSLDDARYQVPQVHTHPAHQLSRSQSNRASFSADSYAAPPSTVKFGPQSAATTLIPESQTPVPGQTTFEQPRQLYTDKEQKKPKRSIFGLGGSKEKENSPVERKTGLSRSASVHVSRKQPQVTISNDTSPQTPSQLSPSYSTGRHSLFLNPAESSNENIPQEPSYYDRRQSQPGIYQPIQGQFSQRSSLYSEDTGYPSLQRDSYQIYRQSEHTTSPQQYYSYQEHQEQSTPVPADYLRTLRPPSQASLGPPSPLLVTSQQDSRPSTADTNRLSTQSLLQTQAAAAMARGDGPNGSLRQQVSQQREQRSGDDHNQHNAQQDPRIRMTQQASDQGRSTPPPRNKEDPSTLDSQQLLQRYEELQAKYSKVKRYYFEREAQVTQLQNTVANQRLSMSKTSLDDAQYSQRFERLSGAINNFAFNYRKDWRRIPAWLQPVTNQDACAVGTKEMTAIGRAAIARWLYETVFERVFHPGIEPGLSAQLKTIERNLRRAGQVGMLLTEEQRDDLTAKITSWRLTTIEGLQDVLSSRKSHEHMDELNHTLTNSLTDSLKVYLTDPPPPGLPETIATIVAQATGICMNIPLESRDIYVEYFLPGAQINETYMKIESGMTPLTNPGVDERRVQHSPDDQGDLDTGSNEGDRDVESEIREASAKASQMLNPRNESMASLQSSHSQTTKSSEKQPPPKKSGFLGGFVGKKPPPQTRPPQINSSSAVNSAGEGETRDDRNTRENLAIDTASTEGKIRFAAFFAVEVRGKSGSGSKEGNSINTVPGSGVNVLFRAPVYEY